MLHWRHKRSWSFTLLIITVALASTLLAGCSGSKSEAPPAPAQKQPETQETVVEGTLAGVGSVMVIMQGEKELKYPVAEGWQLLRDGKPMNGLGLHANVRARATVRDGKIIKLEILDGL